MWNQFAIYSYNFSSPLIARPQRIMNYNLIVSDKINGDKLLKGSGTILYFKIVNEFE